MKIYDLHDREGNVFAFEVDNSPLGRRGACRVIRSIPNAKLLKEPKTFSWLREEVFCEFDLDGSKFQIWEPFGDNSRYWVGPEQPVPTEQIKLIRAVFASANLLGFGGKIHGS